MSYFISKLHIYKQAYVAPSSVKDYKDYLAGKFCISPQEVIDPSTQAYKSVPASVVDFEWYNILMLILLVRHYGSFLLAHVFVLSRVIDQAWESLCMSDV